AAVVIIEPGERDIAKSLMAWRRGLVNREAGLIPVGPCGQEFGGRLPDACSNCWNIRREAFHPSSLYRAFRSATGLRAKEFDDFENRLLSWSYTMLTRSDANRISAKPDPLLELASQA